MDKYDVVVIGSGPAGHTAAIAASQKGLKVAIVERSRDSLGGVCLNEGCIPAKSIYHSAEIIKDYMSLTGEGDEDTFSKHIEIVVKKSRESVGMLSQGLEFTLKKNKVDILFGEAVLTAAANTVEVKAQAGTENKSITAEKMIIATGSSPVLPKNFFYGENVITSKEAISLTKIPKELLIVGGGAIGIEFASYFNLLGSKVTVLEAENLILPREDADISKRVQSTLKKEGVEFILGARVESLESSGTKAKAVILQAGGNKMEKAFDKAVVSIGRKPNTGGLGLKEIGVDIDDQGFIKTDADFKTNIDNLYAIGDIIRTPMLAHTASAEGDVLVQNMFASNVDPIDYSNVPNVVYSRIRVASVGLKEYELKDAGIEVKVGKYLFKSNGRAVAESGAEGLIKIIAEAKNGTIMGVSIIGSMADELIHEFVLARRNGLTIHDLASTVHAHPTYSEAVAEACKMIAG